MDNEMDVLFETEVNHLGVLIGSPHLKRIVALSTSDVFIDKSLISTFWETDSVTIDSGFQAHLYTRLDDVFVVRVPSTDCSVIEKVSIAIRQNYEIWNSLTGIHISSHESHIVLVSDHPPPTSLFLPKNFSWYQGSLPEAAASLFKKTGYGFLAFTFNRQVLDILGIYSQIGDDIRSIADGVSLLMDKNSALELFQKETVDCARTYLFTENTSLAIELNDLPSSNLYVFKPAGGAAGIGLYCNGGFGARLEDIYRYIKGLKLKGRLPHRFQIQEFISGNPYGASAYFKGNGEFEILEIHQQVINQYGKFIGGHWIPAIALEQMEAVKKLYSKIIGIMPLNFAGLLCLDFIDGKVIEVNPRVTASAPIAHIFRIQNRFMQKFGSGFRINQINLNTGIDIPFETIKDGILREQIEKIWEQYRVVCLPQGLNPFGASRMIFINDDFDKTAQQEFIKGVIPYSHIVKSDRS